MTKRKTTKHVRNKTVPTCLTNISGLKALT